MMKSEISRRLEELQDAFAQEIFTFPRRRGTGRCSDSEGQDSNVNAPRKVESQGVDESAPWMADPAPYERGRYTGVVNLTTPQPESPQEEGLDERARRVALYATQMQVGGEITYEPWIEGQTPKLGELFN